MVFGQPARGYLHETRLLQGRNVLCTAIPHTGTNTANYLKYNVGNTSLIWNSRCHAFRNQFLGPALELAIARPGTHSTK